MHGYPPAASYPHRADLSFFTGNIRVYPHASFPLAALTGNAIFRKRKDDYFFKFASYDQLRATQKLPVRKMKIRDAFLCLFTPPETPDYNLRVLREGHLTALDMQMLIHFLYTQIWTALFNNPLLLLPHVSLTAVVTPFKTAMGNWKTIWDETRSRVPESEWNKLGFQRTAETYYDTIMMMVDIWERKGGRFPPMKSDCDKGDHLKRLLSY